VHTIQLFEDLLHRPPRPLRHGEATHHVAQPQGVSTGTQDNGGAGNKAGGEPEEGAATRTPRVKRRNVRVSGPEWAV
jgi:hypothetical protein